MFDTSYVVVVSDSYDEENKVVGLFNRLQDAREAMFCAASSIMGFNVQGEDADFIEYNRSLRGWDRLFKKLSDNSCQVQMYTEVITWFILPYHEAIRERVIGIDSFVKREDARSKKVNIDILR